MKKLTTSIIAAAALAATTVSMAGGPDVSNSNLAANMGPTHKSGVYVNAGAGYGDITNKTDTHIKKSGFVWNAAVGYQVNPYLAVEGGYLALPEMKDNTTKEKANAGIFNLLVKGMYPVTNNLDVFAKAGAGLSRASDTVSGKTTSDDHHYIIPVIGGGADYYVTDSVAVTGQVLYNFDHKTGGVVTFPASVAGLLGLSYKF